MYIDSLLINRVFKLIICPKPRATFLAFGFLFWSFGLKAQVNYVPNPSFEKLVGYDTSLFFDFIFKAIPWDTLKSGGGNGAVVPSPTINFSGQILYQLARTGSYMALINYYNLFKPAWKRSYIQVPLLNKLKSNKQYCVTSYFNLVNRCQFSTDELSMYFDDGSLKTLGPGLEAIVSPQIKSITGVFYLDTLNWMKVQNSFVSNGTENYLTIGNFKPYASITTTLAYPLAGGVVADYYIDDVSVIEADLPAYAGRDTVLCTGDSVFIGRPPEIGLECLWFNPSAGSGSIAAGGGLWVKPVTTQTYMVSQDVCGLIKTAKIQVQVKPKYTGTPNLTSNVSVACLADTVKLNVFNPPSGNKIKYEWLPQPLLTSTTNITAKTFIKQNTLFTHNIVSKGEDAYCPFVRTNTIEVIVPDSCFKNPQIPNIFTPNNDDVNDVWQIKFPYGYALQDLEIYNRWGTLIYERNNLEFKINGYTKIGWDGRTTSGEECSAGVYFYVMKYTDRNNEVKMIKGNLTLMR